MARPEFLDGRKFLRVCAMLPDEDPAKLLGNCEFMWHTCYASGDAYLGDPFDVEVRARWRGARGALFDALLHCAPEGDPGLIEEDPEHPGRYLVHDLLDGAPTYVQDRFRKRGERQAAVRRERKVSGTRPPKSVVAGDISAAVQDSPGQSGTGGDGPGQVGTVRESPALPCLTLPNPVEPPSVASQPIPPLEGGIDDGHGKAGAGDGSLTGDAMDLGREPVLCTGLPVPLPVEDPNGNGMPWSPEDEARYELDGGEPTEVWARYVVAHLEMPGPWESVSDWLAASGGEATAPRRDYPEVCAICGERRPVAGDMRCALCKGSGKQVTPERLQALADRLEQRRRAGADEVVRA